MKKEKTKTATDLYWDSRPASVEPDKVNIDDITQTKLERQFIGKYLNDENHVLEVGCGNGNLSKWLCNRVKKITAFDYSEKMILQAKEINEQENIVYFEDSIINPKYINQTQYDAILCVRVLINLKNLEQQINAIKVMGQLLPKGGKLILIEGFLDGFKEIDKLRSKIGIQPIKPASINFYTELEPLMSEVLKSFDLIEESHNGVFDFLTRIINPILNDEKKLTDFNGFHNKILPLCLEYNPHEFKKFSREKLFYFKKK